MKVFCEEVSGVGGGGRGERGDHMYDVKNIDTYRHGSRCDGLLRFLL